MTLSAAPPKRTPKTNVPKPRTGLLTLPNELLQYIAQILSEPQRGAPYKPNYDSLLAFSRTTTGLFKLLKPELNVARAAMKASKLRQLGEDKGLKAFKEAFTNASELRPPRPTVQAYVINQIRCLPTHDVHEAVQHVTTRLNESDRNLCRAQYIALFDPIPHIIKGWQSNRNRPATSPSNLRLLLLHLLDFTLQNIPSSGTISDTPIMKTATTTMLAAILGKLPLADITPRFDALVQVAQTHNTKLAIALAEILPRLPSDGHTQRFDRWDALLQIATQHQIVGVIEPLLDAAGRLPDSDKCAAYAAIRNLADPLLIPSQEPKTRSILAAFAGTLSTLPEAEQQPTYEWLLRKVDAFRLQDRALDLPDLKSHVALLSCLVTEIHRSPEEQRRAIFDMLAHKLERATAHSNRDVQAALESLSELCATLEGFSPSLQPWIGEWLAHGARIQSDRLWLGRHPAVPSMAARRTGLHTRS
jgi:hypothetical protein